MGTERDFVVKKGLKVAEDIELGHATDTTIARASAGDVNIEGNIVYRAGGTDVPVTDGGTGVSTLTDGGILLGNGAGAIQAMAVLSDGQMIVGDGTTDPSVESGATLRTSIGVGTGDTVQFTGINLGHASDTTIARASAGQITVEGTAVVLAGGANHDGFSDFVGNEHIDHTGVTITAGAGLTGGGTIAATRTLTVGAGDGITVNADDVAITAAQTTITSVLNTGLVIGRDATDQIKFSTDNQIIFRVGNADGVIFKASGEIEATKFDGALEGNADTATSAGTIAVVPNDALSAGTYTDENNLIPFIADGDSGTTAGNHRIESADEFHYNPHTKILTVEKIASGLTGDVTGNISGNAGGSSATVTSIGNLTGDVTSSNRATTIADNAVTLAKMAGLARGKIIYGDSNGDPAALALGSNGQVLTSDGTDISWGSAGGATTLNNLTDVISNTTNFTDSILISPDGAAPPLASLSGDAQNNIGIGKDVLSSLTNGDDNIALGHDALTTLNSGGYNVAIGSLAGDAITSGQNNILLGYQAGSAISTTSDNVHIGVEAGETHTGSSSIFIGKRAGENAAGSSNGISIGQNAGRYGSRGDSSVYIGSSAGFGSDANTTNGSDFNVGVGSSVLANITTGTDNVAVGRDAGNDITTGDYNVAIGSYAAAKLNGENGIVAIGGFCLSNADPDTGTLTAIGYKAGRYVTSAQQLVFVGHEAGTAVTTGSFNTLIGNYSGRKITTGQENVGLGTNALASSSAADMTGSSNVGLGSGALPDLTTGSSNVAVGKNSGRELTTGSYNIAIGNSALESPTTVDYSIAIGPNTLASSSLTGTSNIAIGKDAGNDVTGGNYNTLIGFEAGAQMTSGYANVALGRQANRYGNGNDSIAIGFGSLSNADLAGDRNIGIGYSAGNNITSGDGNVVIGNADVASATGDNQLSISSNSASSPVTWITGNSNGFVTHANGSDHTFAIFGEEGDLFAGTGSTGNGNGYQFSYGNGRTNVTQASNGTDFGINVPHNCVLERIDVVFGNSGNVSSGTTTFVVVKNGTNQSGNLSTSHSSGIHDTHHTGLSHAFTNGDRFNLRTTTSSRQVGPMRMTARFRRTG